MKFLILFCSATLAVATDGKQSENPPAAVPTPAPGSPEAELVSAGVQATVPTTKEERNKAVALRVFEEIFNQGKFSVADEIYAPDFKNHGLKRIDVTDAGSRLTWTDADLKTDQNAVHDEKKAFPDLKMTVNNMVAEGDLVAVHWTFRGTHTHGGYAGLPATGTKVLMTGITIWRIVDGKIKDEWSSFNEMGAYAQVIAHVKWYLLAGFVGLLLVVVVAERLLCWLIRIAFSKSSIGKRSKS
jgi:steroid delta-isomerase-like uncharacterized protein